MFCSNCGTKLREEAGWCNMCGEFVKPQLQYDCFEIENRVPEEMPHRSVATKVLVIIGAVLVALAILSPIITFVGLKERERRLRERAMNEMIAEHRAQREAVERYETEE